MKIEEFINLCGTQPFSVLLSCQPRDCALVKFEFKEFKKETIDAVCLLVFTVN